MVYTKYNLNVNVKSLSRVPLFATPRAVAYHTRLLCPWDFPGSSTGLDCYFLLQGIFPIQGLNPGLLHHRQTLYRLSQIGKKKKKKKASSLINSDRFGQTPDFLINKCFGNPQKYILGNIHFNIFDIKIE